ncbi:BREX system ATP-binding domain-containing protein [uncultured Methanobrevibacter sp.]|uniref:BREX system ATP-binding domain-containing protein n=1 Tax=uncultured Methanobrevibacter sp. TaxID=253161 RepID=UPI0025E1D8B5|nr:BREX system ATP-binding domain-containing protein [uncultured Methanobrevibacter sp.]
MENEDILMALKNGNVPSKGAKKLCVGRDVEIEEFQRLLRKVDDEDKAIVKFIKGEFGAGKSFFLKVIEDMAFEDNFAVSWITISHNLPFNKIELVYRNIAKTLRCKTGTSLEHVLDKWYTQHYNMASHDSDNDFEKHAILRERIHDELEDTRQFSSTFATAIENYAKLRSEGDTEGASAAVSWIRGDANIPFSVKKKFGVKGEINKETALNFLEALSIFIKSVGYSGLVVLIDEVEYIMHLHTHQIRNTSYNYIRDIYDNCNMGKFQSALFVFAGTPYLFEDSKKGIPSYPALEERIQKVLESDYVDMRTPIIYLSDFDRDDLINISQKLLEMHGEVYDWDAQSKVEPIIENIADELISTAGLSGGKVTARKFVRKFITLLDTVEQNQPHFNTPEDILNEFINNTNQIDDEDEFDEFDDDW